MRVIKKFRNDGSYLVEVDGKSRIITRSDMDGMEKISDGWYPVIFYDVINLNDRTYNSVSIDYDYLSDKIESNQLFGIFCDDIKEYVIEPEPRMCEISHSVVDFKNAGGVFYAKIKILDTPQGDLMRTKPRDLFVFRPYSKGFVDCGVCKNVEILGIDAIPSGTHDSFYEQIK